MLVAFVDHNDKCEANFAQRFSGVSMDIIFYHPTFDTQWWIEALRKAIPQARVRAWKSGDNDSADYALVWHPPVEMLAGRSARVFALGQVLSLECLQAHPEMLKPSVPLFAWKIPVWAKANYEYAVSQVLHWFRRFDRLPPPAK